MRGSRHGLTRHEWDVRRREFVQRGSNLPQSRLTESDVAAIRSRHRFYCRKHGAPAIAREYGLHVRTIEKVLAYETWAHVR